MKNHTILQIYTLAICIKNATITKDYCKTDRQWRSGSTCSAIGTLLLIGSENSVFTLTIITGFRMKTVLWPFAKETSMKMIACLMAVSWIVSILLGVIPVFNFTQDFFIDSIWYDRHPLYSTLNKNDVLNLSRSLLTKQRFKDEPAIEEKLGTWSLLESLISNLNSTYKVERRFGYYSTHGVCLPTLFPNPDTDTAWLYSLFILIVNFVAFFVIFIGYVKIYRKTQEENAAVSDKIKAERGIKMQKKISRIILTDFLCWMPVCIMGFLQVFGISIPYDAYVPVGLIIIPINSGLNPFLYSDVPDYAWKKLSPARSWIYKNTVGRLVRDATKPSRNRRDVQRSSCQQMENLTRPLQRVVEIQTPIQRETSV
ncbi:G-protein coupled receptor GRL101-like [Styela clava]